MPKNTITLKGVQARDELVKGAQFLADAVKRTLGPYGQNFIIEKGNRITNDGMTIAMEIILKDEIQNRGAYTIRQAMKKANEQLHDASTTVAVLACAILEAGIRKLESSATVMGKMTPPQLLDKIEEERKEITEKLIAMAVPVTSKEQLIESALVSAENKELAELIGGMQWDLGPEGFILAEEVAETKSSIEAIKGIRIDNGLGTSLAMNNAEKQSLEVKDVHVILTNHVVKSLLPIKPVMDQLAKMGARQLVIVARAFSEEAIRDAMENTKAGFNIFPINAPYVDQNEVMKDLVAVLGGRYLSTEDSDLKDLQVSDVAFAERVIGKRYEAILTGKSNDFSQQRIDKRVLELQEKLKGEPSEFEKRNITARLSQMTHGFALLKVGAESEERRKYLFDKADDCVNAVRHALQEGVVPGAGLAFKTIADGLPDDYILKRPIQSVYEQITFSAPKDFTIPEWVKDPVKLERVALEKACSVAGTLATAGGAIAWENEKPRYVQEKEPESVPVN